MNRSSGRFKTGLIKRSVNQLPRLSAALVRMVRSIGPLTSRIIYIFTPAVTRNDKLEDGKGLVGLERKYRFDHQVDQRVDIAE